MAKRKAKKKSPLSSSPPPSCPTSQVASGPSSPTKKLARHSSLPTQAREVDIALHLTGPNWMPEMCSVPSAPGLAASGPIPAAPPGLAAVGSSQVLAASDECSSLAVLGSQDVAQDLPSASPHPSSTQQLISENSPSFSELFAPIGESETDGSSAYNSDSSSHYGSPVLANSEFQARHPSLVSSAPEIAEDPSEYPAAPPSVPPSSFSAEKAVLSSKGTESVQASVALAMPLVDKGMQDPMICETWLSGRVKSVAAVGNATGGSDLSALGVTGAGSAGVMGGVGSTGQLVGAD
ncbi:hypothetical protein OIU74_005793 [Salix koriyanagi]|uniref:Uncharacterized protein n=1 Tax=Salix koriyanagi TaxID=2511006 RepID=A0A9Q0NUE1_9ROSI|nr:hypothetical protein OIU74_005793 [Salix koriyanagi]